MQPAEPIEWNPSMETGVAAIDDQHKVLVSLLNVFAVWGLVLLHRVPA